MIKTDYVDRFRIIKEAHKVARGRGGSLFTGEGEINRGWIQSQV